MRGNVNLYPFWSPASSGEAERFSNPQNPSNMLISAIIAESQKLRVPEETEYNQNNLPNWQYIPANVPPPQGPAHIKDPFTQARSLLDYARVTVGTSQTLTEDQRGQEGQAHINKAGK